MKRRLCLLTLLPLCVTELADAKRNLSEDPFAYDDREAERARELEAEREAVPTRSFSNAGEFVVSAERLLGYAYTMRTIKLDGPDVKDRYDQIHVLTNSGDLGTGFSTPRLAFDVFVATGFSLGGAFGYAQNNDDSQGDAGNGAGKQKLLTLSPRFGYAFMFGDVFGIWPRMGATYQQHSSPKADTWLLAGSADLPLVIVPAAHVAILLGPRMDLGITGTRYLDDADAKVRAREFGFSAGLSAFF